MRNIFIIMFFREYFWIENLTVKNYMEIYLEKTFTSDPVDLFH